MNDDRFFADNTRVLVAPAWRSRGGKALTHILRDLPPSGNYPDGGASLSALCGTETKGRSGAETARATSATCERCVRLYGRQTEELKAYRPTS